MREGLGSAAQHLSQGEADAAIRAGDQDASMREVEEIFVHERRSIASCGQKSWKV